MNILAVDEVQSLLTLKLKLVIKWKDIALKYLDLKNITAMNTLITSDLNEIWTPHLLFANTKVSQRISFKNESGTVVIEIIDGKVNS